MTEEQLLSIDLTTPEGKQELSRVAGEVLLNESTGHEFGTGRICGRCYQGLMWSPEIEGKPCPAKNKLSLTWQEAMKWRDWAAEKFGSVKFNKAMSDVCHDCAYSKIVHQYDNDFYCFWLSTEAQPAHYILAAVLCEIRSKA